MLRCCGKGNFNMRKFSIIFKLFLFLKGNILAIIKSFFCSTTELQWLQHSSNGMKNIIERKLSEIILNEMVRLPATIVSREKFICIINFKLFFPQSTAAFTPFFLQEFTGWTSCHFIMIYGTISINLLSWSCSCFHLLTM